mmetsp:Transcript_7178/g.18249  ORF Transcript_7178/g.18249 Transcript_7178/m.18249 type:complete len:279 (-) Transcript_7178:211-1047(-)
MLGAPRKIRSLLMIWFPASCPCPTATTSHINTELPSPRFHVRRWLAGTGPGPVTPVVSLPPGGFGHATGTAVRDRRPLLLTMGSEAAGSAPVMHAATATTVPIRPSSGTPPPSPPPCPSLGPLGEADLDAMEMKKRLRSTERRSLGSDEEEQHEPDQRSKRWVERREGAGAYGAACGCCWNEARDAATAQRLSNTCFVGLSFSCFAHSLSTLLALYRCMRHCATPCHATPRRANNITPHYSQGAHGRLSVTRVALHSSASVAERQASRSRRRGCKFKQ